MKDNTTYGAKYRWYRLAQKKNHKPSTHGIQYVTECSKQKPSTIPSINCNNCAWASLVQLVAKISETSKALKLKNSNLSSKFFLELIPDESKMQNYVTASRSNSILDHLSHSKGQGIYQGGGVPDSSKEQAKCFKTTPSISSKYLIEGRQNCLSL